jgi:hypothetical protein
MIVVFTSDLHGERRLYQELLEFARTSSADLVALGGDLLPSFAPTKRYEDMAPYQKSFIDEFLLPFFQGVIRQQGFNGFSSFRKLGLVTPIF